MSVLEANLGFGWSTHIEASAWLLAWSAVKF
jgi:hypothetical protein